MTCIRAAAVIVTGMYLYFIVFLLITETSDVAKPSLETGFSIKFPNDYCQTVTLHML